MCFFFSTPFLFCFFSLDLFFSTSCYSFFFSFFSFFPGDCCSGSPSRGPAGGTGWSMCCSVLVARGRSFFPFFLSPGRQGRPCRAPGRSRCWPLSLRGVPEHYASLPSCLLLAGDDLEGRAWQQCGRIHLRQTDLSAGCRSAASTGCHDQGGFAVPAVGSQWALGLRLGWCDLVRQSSCPESKGRRCHKTGQWEDEGETGWCPSVPVRASQWDWEHW